MHVTLTMCGVTDAHLRCRVHAAPFNFESRAKMQSASKDEKCLGVQVKMQIAGADLEVGHAL